MSQPSPEVRTENTDWNEHCALCNVIRQDHLGAEAYCPRNGEDVFTSRLPAEAGAAKEMVDSPNSPLTSIEGQELCSVLGNLLIHIHALGLRKDPNTIYRDWGYKNTRAESAESELAELREAAKEVIAMWDGPLYKLQMQPKIERLRAALAKGEKYA